MWTNRHPRRTSTPPADARAAGADGRLPPPSTDWPTEAEWARLRAADRLDEELLPEIRPRDAAAPFVLDPPMPGIVRLRLVPAVD